MKSVRRSSARKPGKAIKRKLDVSELGKDSDVEADAVRRPQEEILLAWSPVKLVRIPEM